jgi:PAS domain S-box-containing protein
MKPVGCLDPDAGPNQSRFGSAEDDQRQEISGCELSSATDKTADSRYRLLFERNLAGVFRSTREGRLLDCNDSFARILGYGSREDILSHGALDLYFRKDDREELLAKIKEQPALTNYEFCLRRKDGSPVWVLENVTYFEEGLGNFILEGTLVDITARKQAEEALRRSEERYRAFVQQCSEGIYRFELERPIPTDLPIDEQIDFFSTAGYLAECNDVMAQMYGYEKADDVLGARLHDFMVMSDPANIEYLRHFIRSGYRLNDSESHEQDKEGREKYFLNNLVGIVENGCLVRVWGTQRDITERRATEEENLKLANHVRLLMESIGEGVIGVDVRGRCTFVNRSAARILGREREDLINQEICALLHMSAENGKACSADSCALLQHLREGRGFRKQDVAIQRHDGRSLVVDYLSSPILGRDSVHGAVVTITDLTERKKAEHTLTHLQQQLQQSQKMEAIGRLAGGIAHDFNNLLTAITGYCDLMLMSLRSADPLYQHGLEIKKAADRATSLTGQLLAFSRKQVISPRFLDLNAVLAEMDKMLRRLIGEDVELVTLNRLGLGIVRADPGQIEQVILNLAVNARDAMPRGGKLTIETADVHLDESYAERNPDVHPGPYVMLAVTDTGHGMTEAVKARIFEPFFTTKPQGKGTGLGLATVYGIVKQNGGHVTVYSEPEVGSTFKICLPRVADPLHNLAGADALPPPRHGTETILVVEDEEMVRTLVRTVLRRHGYTVLDACHGGEALLTCEQYAEPIHLLVTDMVMPQMGGRQLAERLFPLRPDMRVLYLSGYTDDAVVRHGILEAGTPFLQKPFTPEALARKVREVLDS